jgi:hypothetical protein
MNEEKAHERKSMSIADFPDMAKISYVSFGNFHPLLELPIRICVRWLQICRIISYIFAIVADACP